MRISNPNFKTVNIKPVSKQLLKIKFSLVINTSSSGGFMSEKLSREIRKLEVRLNEFLEHEKEVVEALKECIEKFLKLSGFIEKVETKPSSEQLKELLKLRFDAIKSFNNALEKMSKAEHEKSHLFESYGALILALEEHYQQYLKEKL